MLTYRVLSHIPDFVPLGGMVLGGIWWITHRREEVALAEGREPSNKGSASESTETNTAKKNGRKP
jgi:formate dehydrogenase iron-sulfur subunit